MALFYTYSLTFEFIFFTLLLLLLLQYTGLASTSIWTKLKNIQSVLNTTKIIIYTFELFFILLLCKLYLWDYYSIIFNQLTYYFSFIFYILYFFKLTIIIIKNDWIFTLLFFNAKIYTYLMYLAEAGMFKIVKIWYIFLVTSVCQSFKLILIINIITIKHFLLLISQFLSLFNYKILIWLNFYINLPEFNTFNTFNFNANLYQYALFDYSYFLFYNKYIIIFFLVLYYIVIYLYYKIPLSTRQLNSKFNYLFSYEYPILIGFLYLGYILVISTNNLLIVYLGFEIQTFTILILSGQLRSIYTVSLTNLKYFFYSFLSSLTFLVSLLYLYNFTYTLNYYEIYLFLIYNWEFNINNLFIFSGLLLLLLSFFFKLGVFPFYIWVLDIFEGFPRFITLLLLTLNKFNLFVFLLKFLTIITTFNLFLFNWFIHILTVVSLSSLLIGSLLALTQTNVHRFFGATSITHMGLLLLLIKIILVQNEVAAYYIVYSYFILYMLLTFIFFSLLLIWTSVLNTQKISYKLKKINFNFNFIKDLAFFNLYSKKTLFLLTLLLLNFSGFPPFSFFYIKFNLIWLLTNNGLYLDTLLVLYFSTIITGSYIRLISIIYLENTVTNINNIQLYKYYTQLLQQPSQFKFIITKFEFYVSTITIFSLFYNYFFYLI